MIDFNTLLSFIAVLFSVFLAVLILFRDVHLFVHRVFAVGLIALAVESAFTGLSARAILSENVAYWTYLRLFPTAILPGIWLLFSLTFSRENYKEFISRWKWVLLIFYILPLSIVIFFGKAFFIGTPLISKQYLWILRLAWPGLLFDVCIILSVIIILMNMERTLRMATGRMRWQIKFTIFGLVTVFGARIYMVTQEILFKSLNISLYVINDVALLVGCFLIAKSLFRTKNLNVTFRLSHTFLYNSLTVLFVGLYLITVGVLAKIALYFEKGENIALRAFIVLIALAGLLALFLSDRLRRKIKKFISRHLHRPLYDYRKEWTRFTENTSSITEINELCTVATEMVAKTFDALSVSIWLLDKSKEHITIGGSTAISRNMSRGDNLIEENVLRLSHIISRERLPIDFDFSNPVHSKKLEGLDEDFFDKTRIQYCIPLYVGGKMIGLMTIADRVGLEPLSIEDFDLLGTITRQVAATLFNLILSEQLRKAKEMEAFQTMSAFFIHDLKNLASKLSLTMQNLPTYFDNPEFRKDAFRSISQSIEKINLMHSRLAYLSEKIELNLIKTNVNEVVISSIASFDGSLREKIFEDLKPVMETMIDSEQIQKVLTNLVLNAHEATGKEGKIEITTEQKGGWALIDVRDNGCGMSEEFIKKSLFQPFRTTKKKGMGVGLYHSKSIIDAHHGRIEVESREGKGSTFTVLLPVSRIS
ncbi:MAG: PEP-CTERM system histidine kinase PrsK [Deltaproteobacteria bacterium]|nr:PEP-CTERM system histidine kinase PrsK [Deltaproteobacteria bacterium]